jgi:hypothetical protein
LKCTFEPVEQLATIKVFVILIFLTRWGTARPETTLMLISEDAIE